MNSNKFSARRLLYLLEFNLPSINTNGPIFFLVKQPQTIIPSECFTVGLKYSFLYFSPTILQTQSFESFWNNKNLLSSLNIILFHSSLQSFLAWHQNNLFFLFTSETKGFSSINAF